MERRFYIKSIIFITNDNSKSKYIEELEWRLENRDLRMETFTLERNLSQRNDATWRFY